MKTRVIPLLALLTAVSCKVAQESAAHDSTSISRLYRATPRIGYDRNGRPAATALSEVVITAVADLPPITPADVSTMVIRTATASIEVDSFQTAITAVHALSARLGGYVANSQINTGRNELHSAEIELKIPAARFDEALSGLTPIGKLESVNVSAEDVGEEYVDVDARMQNAQRLEQRLIGLLATRTGKLKDVLDVEKALADVREEIERYEGRMRYLKAHTAMSTLTVTVHEPAPLTGEAGHSVMGDAWRQAWRNFVTVASLGVQSLGIVVPLGLIVALIWVVWREPLNKRLRRG